MKTIFFRNTVAFILLVLTVAGCNSSGSTPAGEEKEEHGHEEEAGNVVSISMRQAEAIGLKVGEISKMTLSDNIKVTGWMALYPQDRARISPFIGGNVATINVIEGDKITKGQVVAVLKHPDFILLQQELQEANSQLDYLKLEYERKEKLYKENIASARDYQKAKSELLRTESIIKGLEANLNLLGIDVQKVEAGEIFTEIALRSPINGYVHEIGVNLGDYVEPQQTVAEVTNNDKIHVDLRVYEKDIHKVEKGQHVIFTVANHPGKILEAKIASIGMAFEDEPKSVHVHASLITKDFELLPGMYVNGRIVVNPNEVMAVPESALVTEGERTFIFIKSDAVVKDEHGHEEGDANHDENKDAEESMVFEKTEVVVGMRDAGFVEIKFLEAVPDHIQIALTGAYTLSSEMIKGELEHEH
jgi:membrane fusion protein, heavy metal efflux system